MTERIPGIMADLKEIKEDVQRRHEENERRFDLIETKAAEISGQIKIIIGLLLANGALNLATFIHHVNG